MRLQRRAGVSKIRSTVCQLFRGGYDARFERLQRLETLIAEREDVIAASSLGLRRNPATHKGLD